MWHLKGNRSERHETKHRSLITALGGRVCPQSVLSEAAAEEGLYLVANEVIRSVLHCTAIYLHSIPFCVASKGNIARVSHRRVNCALVVLLLMKDALIKQITKANSSSPLHSMPIHSAPTYPTQPCPVRPFTSSLSHTVHPSRSQIELINYCRLRFD